MRVIHPGFTMSTVECLSHLVLEMCPPFNLLKRFQALFDYTLLQHRLLRVAKARDMILVNVTVLSCSVNGV